MLHTTALHEINGSISDPQGIKDMYVFLNKKKVYYRNFVSLADRHTIGFAFQITFEKQNNELILVARDNNEVTARKRIYLRYEAPK